MPKPSWKAPNKKDVFVTDRPTASVEEVDESFTVYSTWESSELWWCGWKNYTKLWSALRFGMGAGYNKRQISYVNKCWLCEGEKVVAHPFDLEEESSTDEEDTHTQIIE